MKYRLYSEVCAHILLPFLWLNVMCRLTTGPKISSNVRKPFTHEIYISLTRLLVLFIAYFSEQELSLEFIRKSSVLSIEEKKRFWKSVNTNLG